MRDSFADTSLGRDLLRGAAAGLLALTAGCASQSATTAHTDDQASPVAATNAPALIDPAVGPSASPPEPASSPAEGNDSPASAPSTQAAPPQEGAAAPRGWRRDGKPVWWLDAPQRRENEVVVCAEALGKDVLDARRAAVAAGEAALQQLLGDEPAESEPLATAVRPLGAAEGPPGAARFVGFVMMRAVVAHAEPATPPPL